MNSFERDLRNVDWEIFTMYKSGIIDPHKEASLWAEVDRLERIIAGV